MLPRLSQFGLPLALFAVGQARAACNFTTNQGSIGTWDEYTTAQATIDPAGSGGWVTLPSGEDACGADLLNFTVQNDYTVPAYFSNDIDAQKVKRAVIVFPGKPRDAWEYFNLIRNARNLAAANNSYVSKDEVLVVAPQFYKDVDRSAGAGQSDNGLVWNSDAWSAGNDARWPSGQDISSFDVIDELVNQMFNTSRYPQLSRVVIAGHSMGAQLANHYSTLRKDQSLDSAVHYWFANPGSFLWLTEDRPVSNATCSGVDDYKYGLSSGIPRYAQSEFSNKGRNGTIERYATRNVHMAQGMRDNGPGDTRCQALTQGSTHLERGQNFKAMVEGAMGGFPAAWTYDTPDCSHDNWCMMGSDLGVQRLFLDGYNDTVPTPSETATSSGGSGSGSSSSGSSNSKSNSNSAASVGLNVAFAATAVLIGAVHLVAAL